MAHSVFASRSLPKRLAGWISEARRTGILSGVFLGRPLWAQLNITDKCNLNCGYCTEHDEKGRHVPYDEVVAWVDHAHKLGIRHLQFIGGEPLMHPQFLDLVRETHRRQISLGLTTNGFLLRHYDIQELTRLGLNRIQVSIDALKPNAITTKALSLVRPVLENLQRHPIWLRVNTVVTAAGAQECRELGTELFQMGIPTAFSPVHTAGQLTREDPLIFLEFFEWVRQQKQAGQPVDMPAFLIRHYQAWYAGEPIPPWSCEGGNRAFYVDSQGGFRYCTHTPTHGPFLDKKAKDLRACKGIKGCEGNCGIQCMLLTSLPLQQPGLVLRQDVLPALGFRGSA
ncbi:MAG TPA: radical SAM protein [Fibrobacteraceae bacterium]|nr:radical SAM protein [Fibrobacteraceae bacterium]